MMNYDVIVIGGGVAGYSAALKCLENGLKTAVVSSGQSALHFSSGSVDLLSHSPVTGQLVEFPMQEIEALTESKPEHPYSKLGVSHIRKSMDWYCSLMEKEGLPLTHQQNYANHMRITSMGTLKATWLSQPYVQQIDFSFDCLKGIKRIVLLSMPGFRDFQPQIAQGNLARYGQFRDIEVVTEAIDIAGFAEVNRNPNEFRSIDISRILRNDKEFKELVTQLSSIASKDDLVVMPAMMGNGDGLELLHQLKIETGLTFHEVPTMPPSLLGIRIEDLMMRTFIRNGGSLLKGDEVLGGKLKEEEGELTVTSLSTKKMAEIEISAKHYVLASGSFFSKGIVAHRTHVVEPIFDLDIQEVGEREQWSQPEFFTQEPHKFLSFGVKTDKNFHPSIAGKRVKNLFCAGAILANYNPVAHGCGSGVAISTACYAVDNILAELKCEKPLVEAYS